MKTQWFLAPVAVTFSVVMLFLMLLSSGLLTPEYAPPGLDADDTILNPVRAQGGEETLTPQVDDSDEDTEATPSVTEEITSEAEVEPAPTGTLEVDADSEEGDTVATPDDEPETDNDDAAIAEVADDRSDGATVTSDEDDAPDPQILAAAIAAGGVGGVAATIFFMRRRITKLQAQLREAEILIQALQPSKRRRPRPDDIAGGTSGRSTAAAKKIGGQSLIRTGQTREAYLMFLDAIESDEDDAEAWLWAGVAAMKLKEYEVAQQTLLQARALGSEKAEDALRKLKDLLDRRARASKPVQSLDAAPVASPQQSDSSTFDIDDEPDFNF